MERRGRLLKPAGRCCSLRGLALARSRVERHIQCQSLLAGCSFGPLELAGDLGGRRLLPRERLEFAHVLRRPLSPFRLLDHHVLPVCHQGRLRPSEFVIGPAECGTRWTGYGRQAPTLPTATVTCRPSQAAFAPRPVPFIACKKISRRVSCSSRSFWSCLRRRITSR